jgi:uncharacterized protein YbaR (Trm112 family)
MAPLRKELLDILACPQCKKPVVQEGETLRCTNAADCGLVFPIHDDIPVMLIDKATDPKKP